MTVGAPLSLYRHLRFCLGSLRAGVNPAPTKPVYLFITPTYDGWRASVFISTSAVLSGVVAGGGKPRPYNNARLSGLIRHSGGGKPRPYNSPCLNSLSDIRRGEACPRPSVRFNPTLGRG